MVLGKDREYTERLSELSTEKLSKQRQLEVRRELESSRDERCVNEDRHRKEPSEQKKLASLYKEAAEKSEEKVLNEMG